MEELVDNKKRKECKIAAYKKYSKLIKGYIEEGNYSSPEEILTTFLALNMVSEVTKKSMITAGFSEEWLATAVQAMNGEILSLKRLQEMGLADQMLEEYAKEKKAKEKK